MNRRVSQCFALIAAFMLLACGSPASGAELNEALTQYGHTAWRIQDGAFSGNPNALAQTPDGYLWIGTQSGLLRFDGVRFVPFPGESLKVTTLLATIDGTLWVGTSGGLLSILDGRLRRYATATGYIDAIVQTKNGAIWFTRSRIAKDAGPLCNLDEAKVRCFGKESGIQANQAGALVSDGSGKIWLEEGGAVLRWSPEAHEAFRPEGTRSIDATGIVRSMLARNDGSVLVGISLKGPGLGLLSLRGGQWSQAEVPGIDSSQLAVGTLMAEQDQSVWIGTEGEGLVRVHHQKADRFAEADGLTGNVVTSMLQDLEGNVWVTTTKGLDCFRKLPVVSYSQRQGLPSDYVGAVTASKDGAVWMGGRNGLATLRSDSLSAIRREDGLPGVRVTTLWEQAPGLLWLGIDGEIFTYSDATFAKVARDDASTNASMLAMVGDTDHNVWALRAGRPYRLSRFDAPTKKFLDIPVPASFPIRSMAADPTGGLLISSETAVLSFRDGVWKTVAATGTSVKQFATYPDGSFWAATQHGLFSWKDHRGQLLDAKSGLPCEDIYSVVLDNDENVWAYASCGLIKVPRIEILKWWKNSTSKVATRLFDVFDGVLASSTPFSPAATKSTDGRLWFANGNIVQTIDPAARSPYRPMLQVRIEEFVADHSPVSLGSPLRLPALTRTVELRYTALSPANAQKLRFRYRLDGVDPDWQDAGARRAAFYNDLRPGGYRFRVVALNKEGTWTEDGAALEFTVLPAWYQTMWFRVAALLALVGSMWTVYSVRIRQVQRETAARYDERMEDRTRLARDLHDTLLQTIQASKMIADVALEGPERPGAQRRAIEGISTWLGQAVEEGRAALQSLRLAGDESSDLAVALENEVARCNEAAAVRAVLVTEGDAFDMHPILQDEVFRIGSEAITNARTHSNARHLSVTLVYSKDLVMRVADDGDGIDPSLLALGRPGHFGIAGMHERATRIGGDLKIETVATGGTVVTLTLPRASSSPAAGTWWTRIRPWGRRS